MPNLLLFLISWLIVGLIVARLLGHSWNNAIRAAFALILFLSLLLEFWLSGNQELRRVFWRGEESEEDRPAACLIELVLAMPLVLIVLLLCVWLFQAMARNLS